MVDAEQLRLWHANRGDQTLRLDYELDPDSIVFDLGGHRGDWAAGIFERYRCLIHIFEPVEEYADGIAARFDGNRKIFVHQFGLAGSTRRTALAVAGDASSIYKKGEDQRRILLIKASDYLRLNRFGRIALMKINIEGGEYNLLEHLIATDRIGAIDDIQVQFHDFVYHCQSRRKKIQAALQATHELTYEYDFVWENWHRKPAGAGE